MDATAAAVRVLRAHYCVRIKIGKAVPDPLGPAFNRQSPMPMPVLKQTPAAGTTSRAWSIVTLTIGIPTEPGTPKNGKATVGIDMWGGGSAPCPPIQASG